MERKKMKESHIKQQKNNIKNKNKKIKIVISLIKENKINDSILKCGLGARRSLAALKKMPRRPTPKILLDFA